jgi:hypothetical protein
MPSKWLALIYNSNLICNDALRIVAAGWLHPVLVFARAFGATGAYPRQNGLALALWEIGKTTLQSTRSTLSH